MYPKAHTVADNRDLFPQTAMLAISVPLGRAERRHVALQRSDRACPRRDVSNDTECHVSVLAEVCKG
jgi:hypothetical protein